MDDLSSHGNRMVERQIAGRGVRDRAVLAPWSVPVAYRDSPLPIAKRQTISQPFIVALTTEALRLGPDDRVLEIGTGSGGCAAVLARIVPILPPVVSSARPLPPPSDARGRGLPREALRKSLDVVEGVDVERRRGEVGDG